MMEQTNEVQVLSLEKVIETKLVQNNVTNQVIGQLKEKYAGLTLKSLDDKESYLEIKQAAKDCGKVRNLAVKVCKEGRERAVKEQKLWVAKEKEVVGQILEIESPLDAEIDKFDKEVKRKEDEERQRKEDANIARQQALTMLGAKYEEGSFVLGNASFEAILIKESSQDVWEEAVLPKFEAEYQKIQAVKIEEERKRAEQEAEVRRQREEFEQQQAAFRKQQEEFAAQQQAAEKEAKEKQQKEYEALREKQQAQNKSRINQLMALGMKFSFTDDAFTLLDVFVPQLEITTFTDGQWDELVGKITPVIAERLAEKAKQEEELRQSQIKAAREQAIREEQERQAEAARQVELKRQQEELIKAEQMAQASDKEKFAAVITQLKAIVVPEMRSGQYRKKAAIVREKLEEILSL